MSDRYLLEQMMELAAKGSGMCWSPWQGPQLRVTYDEKRQGYFVCGSGFDFFAYFTGGPDDASTEAIECDSVTRLGNDYTTYISIPMRGLKWMSCDVLETLIARELVLWFGQSA